MMKKMKKKHILLCARMLSGSLYGTTIVSTHTSYLFLLFFPHRQGCMNAHTSLLFVVRRLKANNNCCRMAHNDNDSVAVCTLFTCIICEPPPIFYPNELSIRFCSRIYGKQPRLFNFIFVVYAFTRFNTHKTRTHELVQARAAGRPSWIEWN